MGLLWTFHLSVLLPALYPQKVVNSVSFCCVPCWGGTLLSSSLVRWHSQLPSLLSVGTHSSIKNFIMCVASALPSLSQTGIENSCCVSPSSPSGSFWQAPACLHITSTWPYEDRVRACIDQHPDTLPLDPRRYLHWIVVHEANNEFHLDPLSTVRFFLFGLLYHFYQELQDSHIPLIYLSRTYTSGRLHLWSILLVSVNIFVYFFILFCHRLHANSCFTALAEAEAPLQRH